LRTAIQRAIAPIVLAFILSGGYILATPGAPDWRLWAIAAASAAAMLLSRINPLWFLAAGGVVGALLIR
jgi:chromate transporter